MHNFENILKVILKYIGAIIGVIIGILFYNTILKFVIIIICGIIGFYIQKNGDKVKKIIKKFAEKL